jgi:hypothetical protein
MFNLKRCFLGIGLALCSCIMAVATPPLTTIQDVLYRADGTHFQGIATISWQSFEAVDSTNIPPQTITVKIVDGFMRVQLVPTTNAITPASYTVVYNSDGKAQFAENWIVPPSNVPLRVREVRVGGPGSVVGGGVGPSPQTAALQISDVLGLTAALNVRPTIGTGYTPSRAALINAAGSIDGAIGNLSDCLHIDGSAGPCGAASTNPSAGFADGEIPSGTIDNSNMVFTLVSAPDPPSSLTLFRNGLLLQQGAEYSLSGATVTFASPRAPSIGDVMLASYRVTVDISGVAFVDAENPLGAVNGANTAFLLTKTPDPVSSLALYRNGLRLRMNLDYTVSGNSFSFLPGLAPQSGDILQCSYRTVPVVTP